MEHRRALISLLMLVTASCGAAGCAGGEAEREASSAVRDAARQASHARAARLVISGSLERAGDRGRVQFSAAGTLDYERRVGRFRLQPVRPSEAARFSERDMRGRLIISKRNVYVRSPAIARAFGLGAAQWRRVPLRPVKAQGIDFMPIGETMNAAWAPPRLRSADHRAERLGRERVGGVQTTRYRTTVKRVGYRTSGRAPIELWIDSAGTVRRIEERFSYGSPKWIARGTRTIEVQELGDPIDVRVPRDVRGPVSRTTAEALRSARRFRGYRLYYAGNSYEGLKLKAVVRSNDPIGPPALPGDRPTPTYPSFTFIYGTCEPPRNPDTGLADGGCGPPVQIKNGLACARPPTRYAPVITRLRGVPASQTGEGATLYTGHTSVTIFAADAPNVAAQLRSLNGRVKPKQRLQPPAPGALRGPTQCPK